MISDIPNQPCGSSSGAGRLLWTLGGDKCGEGLEQCFTFQCWWILYHYICFFDFLVLKSWLNKNSWISWPQKISKGDASPAFFRVGSCFLSFFSWTLMSHRVYPDVFLGIFRVIRKWNLLLMDHLYRFISQIGSFHVLSEGAGEKASGERSGDQGVACLGHRLNVICTEKDYSNEM